MTVIGWIQILLFCAIVVALVKPLGWYMTRVFNGERTFLSPVLRPVERGLYRIGGVDERREQHWLTYTVAMLLFHVAGFLHPLCADAAAGAAAVQSRRSMSAVAPDLVLQHRGQLHHQHQLAELRRRKHAVLSRRRWLGLTHPELPVGRDRHRARGGADPRLRARLGMRTIGNFWVDVTRCTLYVLLPICIVYALFLVWQGMPQTLGAYVDATTLEGAKQTIAVGPVASQVAIKMLGTNGGGFFNANAAHPFENPTALSNFVQMISIFAHRRGAHQRVRPHGRQPAPGLGDPRRRWACCSSPASPSPTGPRPAATRRCTRSGLDRRQHGRQGGPLRHRRLRAVRGHHHRGLLRRGQRHARLASPRSAA